MMDKMDKYEQTKKLLVEMNESWDDLVVKIALLSDMTDGGDRAGADRQTIIDEFDPWHAIDEAIYIIDKLTAALIPVAMAWDTVKKSIPPSSNLDNFYIWKPNIDGVAGISFSDIKRANDLMEKMGYW